MKRTFFNLFLFFFTFEVLANQQTLPSIPRPNFDLLGAPPSKSTETYRSPGRRIHDVLPRAKLLAPSPARYPAPLRPSTQGKVKNQISKDRKRYLTKIIKEHQDRGEFDEACAYSLRRKYGYHGVMLKDIDQAFGWLQSADNVVKNNSSGQFAETQLNLLLKQKRNGKVYTEKLRVNGMDYKKGTRPDVMAVKNDGTGKQVLLEYKSFRTFNPGDEKIFDVTSMAMIRDRKRATQIVLQNKAQRQYSRKNHMLHVYLFTGRGEAKDFSTRFDDPPDEMYYIDHSDPNNPKFYKGIPNSNPAVWTPIPDLVRTMNLAPQM